MPAQSGAHLGGSSKRVCRSLGSPGPASRPPAPVGAAPRATTQGQSSAAAPRSRLRRSHAGSDGRSLRMSSSSSHTHSAIPQQTPQARHPRRTDQEARGRVRLHRSAPGEFVHVISPVRQPGPGLYDDARLVVVARHPPAPPSPRFPATLLALRVSVLLSIARHWRGCRRAGDVHARRRSRFGSVRICHSYHALLRGSPDPSGGFQLRVDRKPRLGDRERHEHAAAAARGRSGDRRRPSATAAPRGRRATARAR